MFCTLDDARQIQSIITEHLVVIACIQMSSMMPMHFPLQGQGQVPLLPMHGHSQGLNYQHLSTNIVMPVKRMIDEADDDIQFISEKPVKRRRISEKNPGIPMPPRPMAPSISPVVPSIPVISTQIPTRDSNETERRLSTGMVGLPSDLHAMELTYALRGVSMPVLENFVLDQPARKPRPSSPPELSPKQLPSTISPAMLNVHTGQHRSEGLDFHLAVNHPTACPSSNENRCRAEKPRETLAMIKTVPIASNPHALESTVNTKSPGTPTPAELAQPTNLKNTAMPPPMPCPKSSQHTSPTRSSLCPSGNSHHHNGQTHTQKHPCQICSRLRQQAEISRAQGIPFMHGAVHPHFMPQLHCQQSYGQHLHPQVMAMPTSNLHPYGPGFAPMMMPINGSPFAALPSQTQPQAPQVTAQQQNGADKDKQPTAEQPSTSKLSPLTNNPKNMVTEPSVTSSPVKPPASLIQPTYRKHSPNLIVDVAETCQERFPFDEVAKRHNVPVGKVFDVFAAIIQVPLLRCPTDRRRPGRLATARIKEYNKAKKDIQDSREGGGDGNKQDATASPMDVAQRLGHTELPEGFTLGGQH
ncbi:hypothetical protein F5Y19DRAFT_417792 [Xylariaceae sp. FL1651]|nr:hypothetical protein F5Y19DRAFT_417792 [Xylariaceae sp. FL1651]